MKWLERQIVNWQNEVCAVSLYLFTKDHSARGCFRHVDAWMSEFGLNLDHFEVPCIISHAGT